MKTVVKFQDAQGNDYEHVVGEHGFTTPEWAINITVEQC